MISLLRPRLPTGPELLPYLERIDKARYYTNRGPLLIELEERFCSHFDVPSGCMATFGNATLGLTLTLQAMEAKRGTLCMMPAWTFIASPLSAIAAGLTPYFVDVDEHSWALTPEIAERAISTAPGPVGAVMPVAPFGHPLDVSVWDQFHERTGIPVVIDAAAAVDAQQVGRVPVIVSLHATKAIGVGEGALIACRNQEIVRVCNSLQTFGFQGSRSAVRQGWNAKMSEYGAAVGLASLDQWSSTRAAFVERAKRYRGAFSENLVSFQPGFGDAWVAATCVVRLPPGGRVKAERALTVVGVETRRWWDDGAHLHPATRSFPCGSLDVTARLAADTIGLPFHLDLTPSDIDHIASTLSEATM